MTWTSVFRDVDLAAVSRRQRQGFTEAVIEKMLVRKLKTAFRRADVKKIDATVPGWRTWPDRIAFVPGVPMHMIELKRPKNGKFEPGQLKRHDTLRKTNCVPVFVLMNEADISSYVATIDLVLRLKIDLPKFVLLSENLSNTCVQRLSSKTHQSSSVSGGTQLVKTGSQTKRRRISESGSRSSPKKS